MKLAVLASVIAGAAAYHIARPTYVALGCTAVDRIIAIVSYNDAAAPAGSACVSARADLIVLGGPDLRLDEVRVGGKRLAMDGSEVGDPGR